jgi:hypothetical protein
MRRDEWVRIENAVDRTEAAVIEEATAIAQIRRQVKLIIEALEKLDLCKPDGLGNRPGEEAARDRYCEILQQLKASYAAQTHHVRQGSRLL